MKLYVNAVTADGLEQTEDIRPSELSLDIDNVSYKRPVHVEVHAQKDKDIINVSCAINSHRVHICSRCLKEIDVPMDIHTNFIYKISGEREIDLNEDIKDTILLEYPMRPLCKDLCKGLCQHCGKDLNDGPCACKGDE